MLESGGARFVFRGPARPGPGSASTSREHGDGVVDLALEVPAAEAYAYAVAHGARGLEEPHLLEDEYGKVVVAAIATYGETRHTLVERSGYSGPFLPGLRPGGPDRRRPATRLLHRRSTTASATSSSAGWTSGWTSTTGSWASPT